MIQADRVTLPVDELPGEAVVVLYFADQKPLEGPAAVLDWRLDGQLTRMLLDKQIRGRAGEHVMLQGNGKFLAGWALFVGGGKWHGLCAETHASLVRHMVRVVREAGFKDVSLAFAPHEEVAPVLLAEQIAAALASEGAGLESCRFRYEAAIAV